MEKKYRYRVNIELQIRACKISVLKLQYLVHFEHLTYKQLKSDVIVLAMLKTSLY